MIRAVIFDFDGVLANSEPLHFRAFREVLATRGLSLSERDYYDRYLGFDDVGAFRAIGADAGAPFDDAAISVLIAEKSVRLEALEHEGSVLFPGARETIARMAAYGPIAIASGALRGEITRVLDREQLAAFFPVIVAAEDTPFSKPDPAPYRLAVERLAHHTGLALMPGECVAVEDSRWGLVSAREAGLRTIGITQSYPAEELRATAHALITHLDELDAALLQRL
jgi:HAD superfamily hydrolase (TIGR01509 family)